MQYVAISRDTIPEALAIEYQALFPDLVSEFHGTAEVPISVDIVFKYLAPHENYWDNACDSFTEIDIYSVGLLSLDKGQAIIRLNDRNKPFYTLNYE